MEPLELPVPSHPGGAGPEPGEPQPLLGDRADTWRAIQSALRKRVQPEQFEIWFRRAQLASLEHGRAVVAVQNAFTRDWILSYYRDVVEEAVAAVVGARTAVEIRIDPELVVQAAAEEGAAASARDRLSTPASARAELFPRPAPALAPGAHPAAPLSPALGHLGLNPKYTFDNFVVGPCNRFAHAAAVGAAESPGKAYNPFFLHGSVGLGKTHLLQSLCFALLQRDPATRILFLSCETFVNHFINALENGDLSAFRNKYRNVDVLVVDDIHILANKERTQEEFFHTFNTIYQSGKQIVLSSDSPPRDIPTIQERLVSRFKWGLVTEIEPPCYETRVAILKRKSRDRGRELSDEVAGLLAERIESNIRDLEGAVTKLIGYASLAGAQVSTDLAREALREYFETRRGQPSMEDILALVTDHYGVKLSELQSKRRTNTIVVPRQVAMYLARQITRHSLEEIGGFFGGRDHSTVIYALEKVTQRIAEDAEQRVLIEGFLERLQGSTS